MFAENLTLNQLLTREYVEKYKKMMLIQPMPSIVSEQQVQAQFERITAKTEQNIWLFQPIDYTFDSGQYAIVYEDFSGQILQQYLKETTLSSHQILQIAIELTNACISIHQHGEIIEHFYPTLISIQPQTHKIKFLAPIAVKWSSSQTTQQHIPKVTDLSFLAPEQTGRVISEIDERTDLYSIGAILFEMLTRKPLFQTDNIADYMFYILTKTPDLALLEQHCQLQVLNQIIAKLLSKNKEDRYQTAFGLRMDLIKAMELLVNQDFSAQFVIGEKDTPFQPMLISKLYGRETEQTLLHNTYNRAKNGHKEIVFISGNSGSGKSTLARTLIQVATQEKGYFLEGKFDQLQEQHSFQPIVEPFRKLLRQIFLEGEQAIEEFRDSLLNVDLTLTDSLLQLIPELKWFVNDRIRITQESKQYLLQLNAFIFSSIQKLLLIFSKKKQPIIIFIDDIHWADHETIYMLKQIYEQLEGGYFLLVIASREESEEIKDELLHWQKELPSFSSIQVRLLSYDCILEWVCDSLHSRCNTAKTIALRLFQMTQGNALFVHEAFRIFIKEKTIFYNLQTASWEYDIEKLHQSIDHTGLFNFIESRMSLLTDNAHSLLQTASCFGHVFDFYLLTKIAKMPYYDLLLNLEQLLTNGFIVTVDNQFDPTLLSMPENKQQLHSMKFQFIHDRIQQSAYETLPHEKRVETHFAISRLLQQEDVLENQLQALVRQLNNCVELLSSTEHRQLALWNLELATNAKSAGLYVNARQYFKQCLSFLPDDPWTQLREQMIQIYMGIGECEYLVGNYEQSKLYIFEALSHTQTTLEKLKVYRLMSLIFIEEENTELVLNAGITAMDLCQMNIKLEPKKWQVAQEFFLLKAALRNKSNEDLLNLKPIENEEIDVLIQIMINIVSNSFRMSSNLTGMILLRLMRLQLKYGAPTESAIVYINYALILISGFNDVKEASRFGKLAVSMAENQENTYILARVYFIYSIFLNHWEKDFDSSIHQMRGMQQNMEKLGLYYTLTAASCFLCCAQLIDGKSLQVINEELLYQQQLYGKYQSVLANDYLKELKHWIHTLKSPNVEPEWNAHITLKDEEAVTVMHYTLRLRMAYLFKNEQQIKQLLKDLAKQSDEVYSLPTTPVYYFFRALCNIDFLKGRMPHSLSKRTLLKEIKDSIRLFKKWAAEAPHQYEHLYVTLLAEQHALNCELDQAKRYYDQALHLAKIYHFPQDEAIIYERTGNVYIEESNQAKASYYISEGIQKIREWGAITIANEWKIRYTDYTLKNNSNNYQVLPYELMSLFDVTQTLANEVSIDEMLHQLLHSVLKQANATSGYFIRYTEDGYYTISQAHVKDEVISKRQVPEKTKQSINIILDYVQQLGKPLIVDNLDNNLTFNHLTIEAKSILCMSIQHKGKTQGFLFLKNHLLYNAFNSVQLDFLRIISTQLAVALENSEIYNELENRVKERTVTLDKMNVSLKDANTRLAINEGERKKLLQSISHELRSPLTSTLGYIESILDGVVQDQAQQTLYLQRSRERLLALNRLIQDLFELAKLEAGRMDFTFTKVSVEQFFEDFAYRFEDDVHYANLTYSVSCKLQPDCYVLVDLLRIEQVLSNFITNAIKYTKEGRVSLSMAIEEGEFVCIVEDSGIGIPNQDLPFIFDSYYRASNANVLNSHGIGLAICKEIITQHQGKIFVDSLKEQGSRFFFTLPLKH
ncbi:hypothetical protein DCE79_14455 [Lysinibacillus sp. 2017]|uniref:AAA family ATPase n=1 Tax=unclassified Lysinibacillus TaxID=2636778 RepID=UPI000D528C26|nr:MULTISPECIES: AAA family ATPase [unclassified Lysinibacillus]AWE08496.1 hypothetical protein DCE79_14455 [Lysinibacillus sp. 2017]TGN31617.1 GAF domain-containing protein [Lysinibacillus sp. S2017]